MKFKKHISLLLAIFLLVSNLGLAINVHYCGGEIASVAPVYLKKTSVEQSAEKACCSVVSKTKEECCKDKVVHFEKNSDNFVVKKFFSSIAIAILVHEWRPAVFLSTSNFKVYSVPPYFCDANAPPFFKLYNQYIFYA
ncbi:HYC_CC_PP family protein [Flavobacterium sp. W1B]|uniref:HYC_CC_PP family protein n=1 Tax=Flavobacterium sp. W1B TaxID=3394146 RepID=UPI0039BCFC9B